MLVSKEQVQLQEDGGIMTPRTIKMRISRYNFDLEDGIAVAYVKIYKEVEEVQLMPDGESGTVVNDVLIAERKKVLNEQGIVDKLAVLKLSLNKNADNKLISDLKALSTPILQREIDDNPSKYFNLTSLDFNVV